jgi:hypothetical protein
MKSEQRKARERRARKLLAEASKALASGQVELAKYNLRAAMAVRLTVGK